MILIDNNEIYHYHLDHLGTPQEMTDSQGKIVWSVSYKAYGNLAVAHVNEIDNPIRFQGQYHDIETGLHYNRHRYYDPNCGQFINQDPIGLAGGLNNYQYVPNPTGWVDPLGLTSSEGPEVCPDQKYLYRGVHANHPALDDAKKGIVKPAKPESNISPELHNQGGYSSASPYTSWTHDEKIAKQFANSQGDGGVLLRVPQGKPMPDDNWSWEFSMDEYFEMETLLKGPRSGAEVLKP